MDPSKGLTDHVNVHVNSVRQGAAETAEDE